MVLCRGESQDGNRKMGVDPRTIFLSIMLILAVMGLAQLAFYLLRPREHYFGYWSLANFTCMAAVVLLFFRGRSPPLWFMAATNTLIVLAWGWCWCGCQVFSGRRPRLRLLAIFAVSCFAAFAIPSRISEEFSCRLLVLSAAIELITLATGWSVRTIARREHLACAWAMYLLVAGIAILIAVRGCWGAMALRPGVPLTQEALGLLVFPSIIIVLTLNMGLTLMVAERMRNVLLRAADRDELTEVLNRRGFKAELWRLFRQRNQTYPGAVVLIDLDYLKVTNDTLGHAAGDRLLRCLAEAVNGQLRSGDAVGRMGGDEFAVALAGVDSLQATEIAERLSAAYVAAAALISPEIRPTMSMGIAMISRDDRSINDLLARADKALYKAKAAGRGRVVVWSPLSHESTTLVLCHA